MHYPVNSYQPTYVAAGIPQQIPQQLTQMFQFPSEASPTLSYKCNFLEQLQGLYELGNDEGDVLIHVLMPTFENWGLRKQGCTIVRRVCADGEALSDQMILEEPDRFILCSIGQEIIAYMVKGYDMKNGIHWTSTDNTNDFFWKRSGQVTFKFVSAPHFDRPVTQIQQDTTSMSLSTSMNSSSPKTIRYHQCNEKFNLDMPSSCSTDSFSNWDEAGMTPTQIKQEQHLFHLIETYCSGRPNLLKKVISWGLSKDQKSNISIRMNTLNPEMITELGTGRLWLCCMLNNSTDISGITRKNRRRQDTLDDLKGAYQEIVKGSDIYYQPNPGANQPGLQHRLRREQGLWIVEERDSDFEWKLRAKEQPENYWLDLKNVHQPLKVKIIPLAKILRRMADYMLDGEIDKQLHFLFKDCNQKKLNTKLKKRNLRHNIQNLKAKLEKQNCLSFAVRVVNVADAIAREYGIND